VLLKDLFNGGGPECRQVARHGAAVVDPAIAKYTKLPLLQ
jgi:hypothetical protein